MVHCNRFRVSATQAMQLSTWRDRRLNQLIPTYRICIDPLITIDWSTREFRLWSDFVSSCVGAARKFHVTDSQNTRDQITSDRRSKRA